MTWLAWFLIGAAVVDLARSLRASPVLAALAGVAAVVVVAAVGMPPHPRDLVGVVLALAFTAAWALAAARSERADARPGAAARALCVLAAGIAAMVLLSPLADPVGGGIRAWLRATAMPGLGAADPTHALLVCAVLLVQLSTGNAVVRLVLAATGTVRPVVRARDAGSQETLKGGRLLGPMERVFIVGLGLAGQLTAAGIVIAAKGLIRWPELQSQRHTGEAGSGPDIAEVTEYFLVGSFVSWLVSLGGLLLLA